jgi:two-component system, OmpR family, KDP operon response regulator KdpE
MINNPEVLVIDDEAQIRKLLDITLQSNNYKVIEAASAKEGLIKAANHPPDLILLDLGLPDKSGHEVLKCLREWYNKPVIILSVQSSEDDIVQALDEGANDYLVKPFRTGELLARLRAANRKNNQPENTTTLDCGDLQIDLDARMVRKNDSIIKLTSTEYALLVLLAENDGKVLTHKNILKLVWGPSFILETQYLRVFVAQLRKKIEDNPNQPKYIITEAGVGYRFMARE